MNLPTLYARASSGKVKQWAVHTVGDLIVTEYGYLTGKKQLSEKQAKAKNVGKSNETTPEEQAELEAQSLWKRQVDKGYIEDPESIPKEEEVPLFLPMLAHSREKKQHKIVYSCFVQPKLDGVRCLARVIDDQVVLWSRKGKLFDVPIELKAALRPVLKDGLVFDGELFHPDWSFQRIIRAVKKYRDDDTPALQYWIYDAPDKKTPFYARFERLQAALMTVSNPNLVLTDTKLAQNWEEVLEKEDEYVSQGYEGLIIRNLASEYRYGHRSNDLLKLKRFQEEEFTILGVSEGIGKDSGTAIFECRVPDPTNTVSVRPVCSVELRERYWRDGPQLVGRRLSVKYQGLSEDGVPRFPIGKTIRDYE